MNSPRGCFSTNDFVDVGAFKVAAIVFKGAVQRHVPVATVHFPEGPQFIHKMLRVKHTA